MKNIKRIAALAFLLAFSLVMFTSCLNAETNIVATYDGDKHIHSDDADFADFYNLNRYYYAYESGDAAESKYEYNTILSEAVKETIAVRVLEEEMAARGYAVDMGEVYAKAESDEATYDSLYEGGFAQFCKDWNLSENVFVLYNKYEALIEIEAQFMKVNVTDKEAEDYYKANPEKYFQIPHYDVHTLFIQVLDPSDKKEKKEAYDDAMLYIQMLNSGRSWENVKSTAFLKYNMDNGMVFTEHLSCLNHVSTEYFKEVTDLEAALAEIDKKFFEENEMTFAEMFPEGFEKYAEENELKEGTSKYNQAFEAYMNYASDVYSAEFDYAITMKWQKGKTYYKPIYHAGYNSYVVLTFTRIEEDNFTITFDEAKEEIYEILREEKAKKAVDNYISQKMDDLKVQIKYN